MGDVATDGILMSGCQQVALAKMKSNVDAVTRLEREETHDPCRDEYASIAAECDVGAACTFQKFYHVAKI
nr:MAG: hypothetical protein [Bacteriophage sp.]